MDETLLIEEILPYITGVSRYFDGMLSSVFANEEDWYHQLRHEQLSLAKKLKPHYDYSYRPDINDNTDPLTKKRPNEPEVIREYRVNMREPVTVSITNKMLTFFGRLFNPRLIKVSYPNYDKTNTLVEDNESLESYLSDMPVNGSLLQFLKEVQLKSEEIDPNAWVTIRTIKPDDELERDELPEPVFFSIPSENVVNYGNTFLITYSTEKAAISRSKGSDKVVFEGHIFFVYTPYYTYKFQQAGYKNEYVFDVITWNRHSLGYVPAIQNGGQLDKANAVESLAPANFYYPFLMASIPHLSVYDQLYNDQQAAFILRVFLERYEKRIECSSCKGNGYIMPKGLNVKSSEKTACGTCNGTGSVRSKGLFDVWKVTVPQGEEAKSPAGYVSLPTDIIEVIENKLVSIESQALAAVNMESLNQNQATSTSGESKKQDRDALYTLLENKKHNLFDRTGQFLADTVNGIRYGTVLGEDVYLNSPTIQGPTKFDIIGVSEVIEIVQKMSEIGSSKELVKALLIDVAKQQYGMDSREAKLVQTELELVPFALNSEDEILTANSMGANPSDLDSIKYLYRDRIINEAIDENQGFLDMPYEEKIRIFNELAERIQSNMEEVEEVEIPDVFVSTS